MAGITESYSYAIYIFTHIYIYAFRITDPLKAHLLANTPDLLYVWKEKRDLCICYKCIPKHTWKHMYILPWTHINICIHVYTNNRPPEVAEHRSTFRTALLGFAIPWIIACSHLRMNIYVCIYTHNSCLREPCIHSPFCCLTRMCLFVNKYMPTLTYTCVYIYVFTQQMPEGSRAQIYLFVALLECTCAGARAVFHCSPTAWICWAP